MSNTKQTMWCNTLIYKDECNIDFLFRKEQFCLQISAPDGCILEREFVAF